MNWYDDPIKSRPVTIHWAGWETDTHKLQRAGWEVSAHEDVACTQMRIALRHQQFNLRGYTAPINRDWDARYSSQWEVEAARLGTVGEVRHMGSAIYVIERELMDFHPVDATPQLRTQDRQHSLDDLAHFAGAMVRTQQIVVPEEDVDTLLARILEKQQAAKTAYFQEQVRNAGGLLQPHKFHAQIISLPRAA